MDILNELLFIFLVSLVVTYFLLSIRVGSLGVVNGSVEDGFFLHLIIDALLLPAILLTVGSFTLRMLRIDPRPLIDESAQLMTSGRIVAYEEAIPFRLGDSLSAAQIVRLDTDGDEFQEWIVFYSFDLQNGLSPVKAVVYDNDRGNPPVIFPYALRPPNRDFISEGPVASIELKPILEGERQQILVWGDASTDLNIFQFTQNSEPWDFPRDAPPRYQPIGFFRGTGGITFDDTTKNVTVIDRNGFERSQLSIRSIFALNPATNTYLDSFDSTKLAAPIVSTIDFFQRPPENIFDTEFPEKIVLAFYASTCAGENETLCDWATLNWDTARFLTAEARDEFQRNNASYFGLDSLDNTPDISVTNLRYFPQLETDPDLLVTGGGRDVVTGEQGQFNIVDVTFAVSGRPVQAIRYDMRLVEGQWKIAMRSDLTVPTSGAPVEVPVSPTE